MAAENTVVNNSVGLVVTKTASKNTFRDNVVRSNDRHGVLVVQSIGTRLISNVVQSNGANGILLRDAIRTSLRRKFVRRNGEWALESTAGSENTTVTELKVGTRTLISFRVDEVSVQFKRPTNPPDGYSSLSIGVEIRGISPESQVQIVFRFNRTDKYNESTLELWQFEDAWTRIEAVRYDLGTDHISVNLTNLPESLLP